jgi:hypothetical protein
MTEPEEYGRYARSCLDLSRLYRAPSHRALLVEMAEAWARLARQAERREAPIDDQASAA